MTNKSLLIINFEGIIGEITKYPYFSPDSQYGLYLRAGVVEGLKKLMRTFQVVVVSDQSEGKVLEILNYFKAQRVIFDGVYSQQYNPTYHHHQGLNHDKNSYFAYSQIYSDFDITPENVKWQVLVLCALKLANIDIKHSVVDDLLYTKTTSTEKIFHVCNLIDPLDKHTASDVKIDPPVTLLVPHILSQDDAKGMSFTSVVTLIDSLYIVSATQNGNKVGSPVRKKSSYTVTTKHFDDDQGSDEKEEAPKPHFFVMNTISISPQNHFRKVQKRVYGIELSVENTSWVHGFNS